MRLVIDAMGGDNAPSAPVAGAVRAVKELKTEIILTGDEKIIKNELAKYTYDEKFISIIHTDEVIENEDEPVAAVKKKKNSSMVVALKYLHDGNADAMLSMGNTGALLTAGLLIVGRIKGIKRPCLGALLPSQEGPVLLADSGANTNCKPICLVQFAMMGSLYMSDIMGIKNPKVGLLSNGTEKEKGDALVKSAHPLIEKLPVNFIGNIEGRDIMEGNAHVIVCDGFTGNVVLKTIEGMGGVVSRKVKGIFKHSVFTKLGALFVLKGLQEFKKSMDYREYGGAPMLGLKQTVIKGHGSSDEKAVFSAILQAKKCVDENITEKITESLKNSDMCEGSEE